MTQKLRPEMQNLLSKNRRAQSAYLSPRTWNKWKGKHTHLVKFTADEAVQVDDTASYSGAQNSKAEIDVTNLIAPPTDHRVGGKSEHKPSLQSSRSPIAVADGVLIMKPGRRRGLKHVPAYKLAKQIDAEQSVKAKAEIDDIPTKEFLLSLVGQYQGNSFTDQLPLLELPDLRQLDRLTVGPSFTVTDEVHWPTREYTWPTTGRNTIARQSLEKALSDRSRSSTEIYELYRSLPAPRVPYLHWKTRGELLRRLGIMEKKDTHSMMRFMSVVDDHKACGAPIGTWVWNLALSFAARHVWKVSDVQVHQALELWREMEQKANVTSNVATFNILFDAATKAGMFRLADMIHQEMEARSIPFNRYHHVSLIHYRGIQGDGDGVRAAYTQLVKSDELVDNVVLNCLITAFFKCGEPDSADLVYSRMRTMHEKKLHKLLPARDFHQRRSRRIGLYMRQTRAKEDLDSDQLKRLQKQSIVAPDAKTYSIMIKHFAEVAGDYMRCTQLLEERQLYNVPLRGEVFLSILYAFERFGDRRYSRWTLERLEEVWTALLEAVEHATDGIFLGKWHIVVAMRAFAKAKAPERAFSAYEEAKPLWRDPTSEDLQHVMDVLKDIEDQVPKTS